MADNKRYKFFFQQSPEELSTFLSSKGIAQSATNTLKSATVSKASCTEECSEIYLSNKAALSKLATEILAYAIVADMTAKSASEAAKKAKKAVKSAKKTANKENLKTIILAAEIAVKNAKISKKAAKSAKKKAKIGKKVLKHLD